MTQAEWAITQDVNLSGVMLTCKAALAHGAYRLRTIRQLLKKRGSGQQQQQFEFIEHHPVIRPLSDYSLDSLHAFRKERL